MLTMPTLENSEDVAFEDVFRFGSGKGGCMKGCGGRCGIGGSGSCGIGGSGCCTGVLALLVGTTKDVRFPSNVGTLRKGFGELSQEPAVGKEEFSIV